MVLKCLDIKVLSGTKCLNIRNQHRPSIYTHIQKKNKKYYYNNIIEIFNKINIATSPVSTCDLRYLVCKVISMH